jgi:hypothetical protein
MSEDNYALHPLLHSLISLPPLRRDSLALLLQSPLPADPLPVLQPDRAHRTLLPESKRNGLQMTRRNTL